MTCMDCIHCIALLRRQQHEHSSNSLFLLWMNGNTGLELHKCKKSRSFWDRDSFGWTMPFSLSLLTIPYSTFSVLLYNVTAFLLHRPRSIESVMIFHLSQNNNWFIFHLHSKIAYYLRLLGDFFFFQFSAVCSELPLLCSHLHQTVF